MEQMAEVVWGLLVVIGHPHRIRFGGDGVRGRQSQVYR